jgi:YHS domain-containing protein
MFLRKLSVAALALSAALAAACAKDQPATSEAATPPQATAPVPPAVTPAVTRIEDASLVCMVNDTYMGRAQIPVAVGGKTYFGCCDACKGRLETESQVRTATDPVTGVPVDKATAVLAQDANGKVLYFASVDTLNRYRP